MCFCGKKEDAQKPVPLFLYGKELPWVATATHLGHELHDGGSMSYDIKCKGNGFISKSSEVRESFSFAHNSPHLAHIKNVFISGGKMCIFLVVKCV